MPELHQYIQVNDWNDATETGHYAAAPEAFNTPAQLFCTGSVQAVGPEWVVQRVQALRPSGAVAPSRWRRQRENGVWSEWERIFETEAETLPWLQELVRREVRRQLEGLEVAVSETAGNSLRPLGDGLFVPPVPEALLTGSAIQDWDRAVWPGGVCGIDALAAPGPGVWLGQVVAAPGPSGIEVAQVAWPQGLPEAPASRRHRTPEGHWSTWRQDAPPLLQLDQRFERAGRIGAGIGEWSSGGQYLGQGHQELAGEDLAEATEALATAVFQVELPRTLQADIEVELGLVLVRLSDGQTLETRTSLASFAAGPMPVSQHSIMLQAGHGALDPAETYRWRGVARLTGQQEWSVRVSGSLGIIWVRALP